MTSQIFRFAGHCVEMSVAMVAPFVVLLAPHATGAMTTDTRRSAGHVLMLIAMLAAMLLRRRAYTERHRTASLRNRLVGRLDKVAAP